MPTLAANLLADALMKGGPGSGPQPGGGSSERPAEQKAVDAATIARAASRTAYASNAKKDHEAAASAHRTASSAFSAAGNSQSANAHERSAREHTRAAA